MRLKIIGIHSFLLLAIAMTGCQSGTLPAERFFEPDTYSPPPRRAAHGDGASYYYFSSAQMKLKQGDLAEAQRLLEKAIEADPQSALLKLELAELFIAQKNADKALLLIRQVLDTHPEHTDALISAGRIYQERNAMAEAKELFEHALANNPPDPNLYLYLGRIYWNENDFSNAERVFRGMANRFPDSFAAHYFNGKVLAAQGKIEPAEIAFLRSLELEPSLEEPRLELIKIYSAQQRNPQVLQMYRAILEYHPDNIAAGLEMAMHYQKMGESEQSHSLLTELGRRSLSDGGILTFVYEQYLENKQYEMAVWAIEGMLKGARDSSELHYLAGVAHDGLKHFQDALSHLAEVSPDSQFYMNAVVHRAVLLRNAGKLDQSIEVLRQALRHDPQKPEYYLYLGTFYEEREQYEEALKVITQGLAQDETNIRLHFRMGVIKDKAGHRQAAIESMKRVLEIQPEDVEALNYLGYTYADLGVHLKEAESLIQQALAIKPNDGYITDSMAWVYYKQGKYEEALHWLAKAEALVPNDPVILEHLGDVHLKLNSKEKALTYYERSLELKSDNQQQLAQKIRAIKDTP